MHSKNHFSLMNYKNITFFVINNANLDGIDLSQFDVVYSPCEPINVNNYPNTKFIFGPHFSVFPEINQMNMIRRTNVTYIHPSEWAAKVWRDNPLCKNIKVEPLPFGVDVERFKDCKSISERDRVFVYFKNRNPQLLSILQSFLNSKNIGYQLFNYDIKYDENDYIECLKNAKYGIWLGRHESQGFALEEALSMNVPLLVWNVTSMNEEYRSSYNNIPASVIPYWDERCGEYFYNVNDLENIFNIFISKLETYRPREYILENLTMEKCEQKLIQLIQNI
jgi:hypothetical protein